MRKSITMNATTKIPSGTTLNFQTLLTAHSDGRISLIRAYDKTLRQDVTLICAVNAKDNEYEFIPLAVMIEENPFERFVPPT